MAATRPPDRTAGGLRAHCSSPGALAGGAARASSTRFVRGVGFFNACFEQKEQLEPYVAEQIARELYSTDPALRESFHRKLDSDAAFRADPAARLEFFWRHHASWDDAFNCYPICRL